MMARPVQEQNKNKKRTGPEYEAPPYLKPCRFNKCFNMWFNERYCLFCLLPAP